MKTDATRLIIKLVRALYRAAETAYYLYPSHNPFETKRQWMKYMVRHWLLNEPVGLSKKFSNKEFGVNVREVVL